MLALIYTLSESYLDRRGPLREAHLDLLRAAHRRGEVLLGGAFSDTFDQALIVWSTEDRAVVEEFIEVDPYVLEGLVTGWTIRSWNVVVGGAEA